MIFRSNFDDVQLIVGMEMEEDIKREAFVWTNHNPASEEDDIKGWYIQYKQGRHLAIHLIFCSNCCLIHFRQRLLNKIFHK